MDVTLLERVDALIHAPERQLLSTTPSTVAIGTLAERVQAIEQAVHEMAVEIERLTLSSRSSLPPVPSRRFRRTV